MVGLSHMRGATFWQEKLSGILGGSVVAVASVRGSPGPLGCTPSGPSHCVATPICLCVQLEGDRFPLRVAAGTGAQSQASAGRRARRSKRTGGSDQGRGRVRPCQSKSVGWFVEGGVTSWLLH